MTSADDLLDDLQWRGLIASSTDLGALRAALDAGPVTFYSGVDPTAPSMHMGNLVQWVTARRLQQAGHRPLALIGGATGLIGDPSGKNSERVLNDSDVVAGWAQRIRDQVSRFIDFDGPAAATMVNNLDWTAKLSAIEWLRDIGKHFSVNRMIDKESVRARLHGDGISYTEFSYQVLQANDYLELHRQYGCTLQTGGNDQWGNITAGVDLVRRVTGRSVHALTTPLITKADGTKFGKTESGTVWLDPDMTSPYAFYQFLVNADDRDVITYLKVFSSRPREEIQTLEKAVTEQPSAREAQHALADELTALVHGPAHRDAVVAASLALFGRGSLTDLDGATLAAALGELPTTRVQLGPQHPLPTVVDLMAATGLSSSRSAARRAVEEGGAYLNNTRVLDADARPRPADLLGGRWLLLRRGKRTLAAVDVASETVS